MMKMFDQAVATELLTLATLAYSPRPKVTGFTLDGSPLSQSLTTSFTSGPSGNSDTQGFISASEAGDIVVAFRGSEFTLVNVDGSLKDWVTTDFRSNRMAYPPQPGAWPNQTWVHKGFWLAY